MPTKGDSLRELMLLQRRLNRLFDDMLEPDKAPGTLPEFSWTPSADVYEDSANYFVEVELPGVDIDDVEVTAEGNVVRISGERKAAGEPSRQTVQRMERYFGPFLREFSFPDVIDSGRVAASLNDGILLLKIPRKDCRRSIEVK
jgi:HSP20 family protein